LSLNKSPQYWMHAHPIVCAIWSWEKPYQSKYLCWESSHWVWICIAHPFPWVKLIITDVFINKSSVWILCKQNCLAISGRVAGVIFQVPPDNRPSSSYLSHRFNKAAKISFILSCSVLFVDSASFDEFERIVRANAFQIMNNNIYFSSFLSTRCTTSCCD